MQTVGHDGHNARALSSPALCTDLSLSLYAAFIPRPDPTRPDLMSRMIGTCNRMPDGALGNGVHRVPMPAPSDIGGGAIRYATIFRQLVIYQTSSSSRPQSFRMVVRSSRREASTRSLSRGWIAMPRRLWRPFDPSTPGNGGGCDQVDPL
ncbi:hypothetical protein FRB94_012707 [Tulasnella sp. JGI-2019a]|nr:hypothetical protein FRB94_012707 [Tulasnella sp. JGI-2019a]